MRDDDMSGNAFEAAWYFYGTTVPREEEYRLTCCSPVILTSAFASLPNLREINVSLTAYPFENDLLRESWLTPSNRFLPRDLSVKHFTSILTAMSSNSSTARINALSHDRLPFEFFAQRQSLLSTIFSAVGPRLLSLDLSIDFVDLTNRRHHRETQLPPNSQEGFRNLELCLRSAPHLRTLNLAFQSSLKVSISTLLCSILHRGFSFPLLERLKFEGISATEAELAAFLVAQKGLKTVQLGGLGVVSPHQAANGGVHLREGSFRGLFARLRGEMDGLVSLKVQGDLKGWRSGEMWILDDVEDEMNLGEYVID